MKLRVCGVKLDNGNVYCVSITLCTTFDELVKISYGNIISPREIILRF